MERALVKNSDNSIFIHKTRYAMFRDKVDEKFIEKNRLDNANNLTTHEIFSAKETDKLLSDLANIILANTDVATVNYLKKNLRLLKYSIKL
jgi:hypothetical protein